MFKLILSGVLTFFSTCVLAENGVSEKEIILGQSAAISGPASALGSGMNQGIRAYFEYINSVGGVNGRKLSLRLADDGYEASRAAENTKKLIENDKVFALIGYVGTPTTLAALPILTEAKVPLIGPFTGAQSLREPFNPYLFHVRASYFDETEKIVAHLLSIGQKKIAVFYQDDAYGKAGLAGVEQALKKRNMQILATGTVQRNSIDLSKALSILSAKPDAIVQISAYTSCAAFILEARKRGYTGQFVNVSFVGSKALADALGKNGPGVMISQVVPFPFSGAIPLVRDYQKHMALLGFKDYDFTSLEGYIAAKVMVEGLKRAGRNLSRENLISALETLKNLDLGGFEVSFSNKNHAASKFVDLSIIASNGKFQH
ncbi:MAG: ABC transporter substrate-binding protein [Burkholderiaceae bacterium]|nr:ABC transporter substrate-binding protein [Burkholderiaceae bacterium]